jgi:hypothetical protein
LHDGQSWVYVYQQISGDSGSGAMLGGFEFTRYPAWAGDWDIFFPAGNLKAYLNLKDMGNSAQSIAPSGWKSLAGPSALVPPT